MSIIVRSQIWLALSFLLILSTITACLNAIRENLSLPGIGSGATLGYVLGYHFSRR
jgi:hypothetical protein